MSIYDGIEFDGAIFDMDGLVFDTERIYHKVWKSVGKDFGYEVKDEHIKSIMGTDHNFSVNRFKEIFGEDFPFDEIAAIRQKKIDEIFEKTPPKVKDGFYPLMAYLKERKIKTAIATSTRRYRTENFLKSANIFDCFDVIICVEDVKKSKPDPFIFLLSAERLGVDIKKCIVFEDSINGIIAAERSGAIPVMVPDTIVPTEEIKNKCFRVQKTLWEI